MYKRIAVITLFLLLLCLCSCSNRIAESESSSASSIAESNSADESLTFLGTIPDFGEVYQKTLHQTYTRKAIIQGKDGVLNHIEEIPATEYRITDENGNSLISHPFYDFEFFAASEEEPAVVQGCYDGDSYIYHFINGSFQCIGHLAKGEFKDLGEAVGNSNYIHTRYQYNVHFTYCGLNDLEGNVIFEPIFTTMVDIPFNDRFIGFTDNEAGIPTSDGNSFSCLFDENKNILCTYSYIQFESFSDGSYIGIAEYRGHDNNQGQILRDKNGKILETGYRFIDKDGNEISPCFASLPPLGSEGIREFVELYSDTPISATYEDGNAIEIKVSDYLCKP